MYEDLTKLKDEELFNTNYRVKLMGRLSDSAHPIYFFKSHEEIYVLKINSFKDTYEMYNKAGAEEVRDILETVKNIKNREIQLLDLEVFVEKDSSIIFDSNFLEISVEDELPFDVTNIKEKFNSSGVYDRYKGFVESLFDKRTLSEIIDSYKTKGIKGEDFDKKIGKEESRF